MNQNKVSIFAWIVSILILPFIVVFLIIFGSDALAKFFSRCRVGVDGVVIVASGWVLGIVLALSAHICLWLFDGSESVSTDDLSNVCNMLIGSVVFIVLYSRLIPRRYGFSEKMIGWAYFAAALSFFSGMYTILMFLDV